MRTHRRGRLAGRRAVPALLHCLFHSLQLQRDLRVGRRRDMDACHAADCKLSCGCMHVCCISTNVRHHREHAVLLGERSGKGSCTLLTLGMDNAVGHFWPFPLRRRWPPVLAHCSSLTALTRSRSMEN